MAQEVEPPYRAAVLRSHGLVVSDDGYGGRCLRSVEGIPTVGTVVLRNQAYAVMAGKGHCTYCLVKESDLSDVKLSRCARCHRAYFCGPVCLRRAWDAFHKAECRVWRYLVRDNPEGPQRTWSDGEWDEALMAWRALIRNREEETQAPGGEAVSFVDVCGMVSHSELDTERWSRNCIVGDIILDAATHVDRTLPGVDRDTIAELLCRMQCNDFSMWGDLLFAQGSGIFPVGGLANHSCAPNCVLTYHMATHTQEFRNIRPIEPDESITHCYCDLVIPPEDRRAHLKKLYYFQCSCARCSRPNEVDTLLVSDSKGVPVHRPSVELQQCRALVEAAKDPHCPPEESIRILAQVSAVHEVELHAVNTERLSALCWHLNACIEAALFERAYPLCRAVLQAYRTVYPQYHPLIGLQLCTLADLTEANGNLEGARQLLTEAHTVLLLSHGPTSELVASLAERLRDPSQ